VILIAKIAKAIWASLLAKFKTKKIEKQKQKKEKEEMT
jgi:hypothetical protein